MSIWNAVEILLAIIVVIDLALTTAIIRRLRAGVPDTSGPNPAPEAGFRVDLARDDGTWSEEAVAMLDGPVLVAFVMQGCPGCESLHRDLVASVPIGLPIHLILDADGSDQSEYLASLMLWPQVTKVHLSPAPINTLVSFGHPWALPTLVVLSDATVITTAHRLADIKESVAQLHGQPAIARH